MAKKLMGCPGWLELSDDRTSFVFMPDRAAIVRRIFEASISGLGGYTIASRLNAQEGPAFALGAMSGVSKDRRRDSGADTTADCAKPLQFFAQAACHGQARDVS